MRNFLNELQNNILVCDGAMGTELQKRGLQPGESPELLNIEKPEIVFAIHQDYIKAGADIITTNTFGANSARLKLHELDHRVEEICDAALKLARKAAGEKFVFASIGPLGEIIAPLGELPIQTAREYFERQISALANSEIDGFIVETMMALDEMELAVNSIQKKSSLPVIATMTFENGKSGLRTMWGVSVEEAVQKLTELKVDVIGANCGNGFDDMIVIMREMRTLTSKPIIAQANAGIPKWIDGKSIYTETPDSIKEKVSELIQIGANIIGGCCGSTPEHICAIRNLVDNVISKAK